MDRDPLPVTARPAPAANPARSNPRAPARRRDRPRRALSVVELIISLVVTAMVMTALAALWSATGTVWRAAGAAQGAGMTAAVTTARIEQRLRASRFVFQYASGSVTTTPATPAAVFYWKADNWLGSSDGTVQLGEMALIEHDAATNRLYLYEPIAYATMTAAQRSAAAAAATAVDMYDAASRTNFKKLTFVRQAVLSEAVTAAAFYMPGQTAGARPVVEFTLKIARPEGTLTFYGACAQRAAAKPG